MVLDSSYVSYKAKTGRLLYWLIQSSNSIIQALDASGKVCSLQVNLSGRAPVSDLVSMAKLIAKHRVDIPPNILPLFHSVIELRTIYYSQFQGIASITPSEELLENNSKHKHFIDVLTKAFHILGGEAWLAEQAKKQAAENEERLAKLAKLAEQAKKSAEQAKQKADAKTWTDVNIYASLVKPNNGLESDTTTHGGENNGDADEDASSPQKQRKKQTGKRKGKKGKGKKARRSDGPHIDDVPLGEYHIIEDEELQHYFRAVFSMAKDWMELRALLQDFWRKVAYRNLNSALAAALGAIAVAMIKRSEAVIFGDFPGYESLDMMILTFTHGDPERAATECRSINNLDDVKGVWEQETMPVDVQEAFLINTYDDLIDFINDFQKSRSGKPTKRMLAQLKGWDPYFDLQHATPEDRLKWRRSYTINWLYELVNSVAAHALFEVSENKGKHVLEETDWGAKGPFHFDKRLFGLFDFAVEVTTLAMQKPGTPYRHKITPHLVFHLQCIMDAWTISRGWAVSGVEGHVLSNPAPDFAPQHHLDMFLGRGEWATKGFGFSRGVAAFKSLWETFRHTEEPYEGVSMCIRMYEELGLHFDQALGVSVVSRVPKVVPSRFATTNPNGLWDYSPFLCGAGLVEALELSYRCSMVLWDKLQEFLLVVYMHGLLETHHILESPLPLFKQVESMFHRSFFVGGKPSYDFSMGFPPHSLRQCNTHDMRRQDRPGRRAAASPLDTVSELLDMFPLQLYKHKSELALYQKACWHPDRIPDSNVHHMSALGLIRLSQTSRLDDKTTLGWMLEGAELLQQEWQNIATTEVDVASDPVLERVKKRVAAMNRDTKEMVVTPNYIITPLSWIFDRTKAPKKDPYMTSEMMLGVIWNDLYADICCEIKPYSSLNYLWVTINVLKFYDNLEEEAMIHGSPRIKALFEETIEDLIAGRDKRISASLLAMQGKDKELIEIVRRAFAKNDPGMDYVRYFDDERPEGEESGPVLGPEASPCCVM